MHPANAWRNVVFPIQDISNVLNYLWTLSWAVVLAWTNRATDTSNCSSVKWNVINLENKVYFIIPFVAFCCRYYCIVYLDCDVVWSSGRPSPVWQTSLFILRKVQNALKKWVGNLFHWRKTCMSTQHTSILESEILVLNLVSASWLAALTEYPTREKTKRIVKHCTKLGLGKLPIDSIRTVYYNLLRPVIVQNLVNWGKWET